MRYSFTGEYIAYDSATEKCMKLTSGMTISELEGAAKAAGVTYKNVTNDSARVGNEMAYFKDGKLDEIAH